MGKRSKYMYGKMHHETSEFYQDSVKIFDDFFRKHEDMDFKLHNEIIDLRNRMHALFKSWIGSKKVEQKFGIKIPLTSSPPSMGSFLEKQMRSYRKKYRPCEICQEDRITNFCHIIPNSVGGPDVNDNYIYLCPLHHHLFDHCRLKKEEWDRINFSKKREAAREYVKKIIEPQLIKYWKSNKSPHYPFPFFII